MVNKIRKLPVAQDWEWANFSSIKSCLTNLSEKDTLVPSEKKEKKNGQRIWIDNLQGGNIVVAIWNNVQAHS